MLKRVGLFYFVTASLTIAACQTTSPEMIVPPPGVDVVLSRHDKVDENPASYIGRKAFAQGKVQELLTQNTFVLDYAGGSDILVIQPHTGEEGAIVKGKTVDVVGDLVLLSISDMEHRLGRSLDRSIFQKYENKPVMVTDSVLSH